MNPTPPSTKTQRETREKQNKKKRGVTTGLRGPLLETGPFCFTRLRAFLGAVCRAEHTPLKEGGKKETRSAGRRLYGI